MKPDKRLTIFMFLWTMVILFDLVGTRRWYFELEGDNILAGWFQIPLAAAALAVLWRPASWPRFMLMIGLHVVVIGLKLPIVSNHALIIAFANLTMLLAWMVWRYGDMTKPLYEILAPSVRIQLLILYFFAILHKLNIDFLTPAESCATIFYLHITEWLPFLPSQLAGFSAVIGIVAETAILLLLCWPRGRVWGILVGMAFHSMLTLDLYQHFFDFSSLMFALYWLFVPDDFLTTFEARWHRLTWRGQWYPFATPALYEKAIRWLLVGVFMVSMGFGFFHQEPLWFNLHFYSRQLLWFIYGPLLILMFGLTALTLPRPYRYQVPFFHYSQPLKMGLFMLIPLLLILNGFSPYLGLRTGNAFDMYSNLRIEGGRSNHLIFQRTLGLFTDDVVTIISSSDPFLQSLADQHLGLVYFTFRDYLSHHRNIVVTYQLQGRSRIYEYADLFNAPSLFKQQPWLLRKLLYFRAVDLEKTTTRCIF